MQRMLSLRLALPSLPIFAGYVCLENICLVYVLEGGNEKRARGGGGGGREPTGGTRKEPHWFEYGGRVDRGGGIKDGTLLRKFFF